MKKREAHGQTRGGPSKTYQAWASMHARCKGNNPQFRKDYLLRGITVCKRWAKFKNFLTDMGEVPKGRTLDRIKNERGYSPSNCRWATRLEQMQNTRRNVFLTYRGETLCLSEWARRAGMRPSRIQHRLAKGWSIERILTTVPFLGRNAKEPRRLEFRGEAHTVSEWADILDIRVDRIKCRLRRGWSVERTLAVSGDARYNA